MQIVRFILLFGGRIGLHLTSVQSLVTFAHVRYLTGRTTCHNEVV